MKFLVILCRLLGLCAPDPAPDPTPPPPPPRKPLPEVEKDVPYGTHDLQKLDIYRPPGMFEGDTAPTIDMTHGGGWQNDKGDKANDGVITNKRDHYLALGYVVVSGNYRLWTETNGITPADEADDVARKFAFVSTLYGVDCNKITLMGHSAGGNLVAQVAVSPELLTKYNAPVPYNVVCLDAIYDIPHAIKLAQASGNQRALQLYAPFGTDPVFQKQCSPTYKVSQPAPRMMLAYSTQEGPGRLTQAAGFSDAIVSHGGPKALVKGYDYKHGEMDSQVGLDNALTKDIDNFIR